MFNKESSYPWRLLLKTVLLWVTYVCCGMADSVRGPTLMDLKDLIQEDISSVSTIFVFKSFGGLIGVLSIGLFLDHFNPSVEYLYLALAFLIKGVTTLLLPFSPNLISMQSVEFIYGFFHGSFHSVANTLILRIWSGSGHNTSPYMYAMHFCYGIGALVTPILTKPFLSVEINSTMNTTMLDISELELGNDEIWTIKTLYPIIFIFMIIPTPFFLHYFITERKSEKIQDKTSDKVALEEEGQMLTRRMTVLLMMFAFMFYFAMAGIEHGFRSFTAVFCVNSSLKMTKNNAADVLAILYLTFAGVRGLLIPLSTFLSSKSILTFSSLTLLVSTSVLSGWAESSSAVLTLGIALTGAGIASMFAAGMLWLQNVVKLNNRMTAIICFGCRISEQFFSLIIGMMIETNPMSFLFLMTGNVICVIVSLSVMNCIATSRCSRARSEL